MVDSLSMQDIARLIDMNHNTVRIYCNSWVLAKYFSKNSLKITEDSINKFYTYLVNRHKIRQSVLFKQHFSSAKIVDLYKDLEIEDEDIKIEKLNEVKSFCEALVKKDSTDSVDSVKKIVAREILEIIYGN